MATKNRPWTVGEHGPIEKLEENLWVVADKLPGTSILRRMGIVKRSDGTLLFYHAIPVTDAELDEIRAWGKPTYLVVGHHQHMVDAHALREKLGLKLYGPKETAEQIRARTVLDGVLEDIPSDPNVEVKTTPGSKLGEAMMVVKSANGTRVSLFFCDAVQNSQKSDLPFFFRLMGFAGDRPKVVPLFRLLFLGDRQALKQALLAWAEIPNLARIIPFHGTIADQHPAEDLRAAANDL